MDIEQEIQAKGLTAPRITPADIEANIVSEHYFTGRDGACGAGADESSDAECPEVLSLLTFCVLVLENGFTVTGESACASPENYDVNIGRKVARANAVAKIWPLMGYELRTKLAQRDALHAAIDNNFATDAPLETSETEARAITPGLALDSGEFIPAAQIPHHPV